jgi:hypothetical protein
MISGSPTETARYLIQHAGSVQAAHSAIARAVKEGKQERGRPSHDDKSALLIADAIRRADSCSDNAALRHVAALFVRGEDNAAAMVRRLRRKLEGMSLAEYARGEALEAVREKPGQYAFKLR